MIGSRDQDARPASNVAPPPVVDGALALLTTLLFSQVRQDCDDLAGIDSISGKLVGELNWRLVVREQSKCERQGAGLRTQLPVTLGGEARTSHAFGELA
jgi:hypothetical protein